MKLTVFFDGSFWCGLIEYLDTNHNYRVIKHRFGPEPKDAEVVNFVWKESDQLIAMDEQLHPENQHRTKPAAQKINPKRMQRKINREKNRPVFSTKAQLALAATREEKKQARNKVGKEKRALEKQRKFELKQAKKHQKQKGH